MIYDSIGTHNVPLWSDDGIADLRRMAATAHYPLARIYPLLADAMTHRRAAHIAQTRGDVAGETAARLAMLTATSAIESELDKAADTGLALLALAIQRRPHEVRDLLASVGGKGVRYAAA
ncbi:MAG: hypothetical protein JNK93_13690 [Planctomycetia bacterium]|nr:hypothetical protein [Planctomycetia bacterium]